MEKNIKIKSALISVFSKDGLEPIVRLLQKNNVKIFSTGGTYTFIDNLGVDVEKVEDLTSYPSILGGRVKTLHPKVFGGILAKREQDHIDQLNTYDIPEIDLVIVDLYPFEKTVAETDDETAIIEKIDIGGISLIRAAAKNYKDVAVVPSIGQYQYLEDLLAVQSGKISLKQRKYLATKAFQISSKYDSAIAAYFQSDSDESEFEVKYSDKTSLRYGENPHQNGAFYGPFQDVFNQLGGKELSYNNLVDIDAAVQIMAEFKDYPVTFAVLKHTNACGLATESTTLKAWEKALAGDPISAFGGILITNGTIDIDTAKEINKLFYEVLIAPDFEDEARKLLLSKKKRIVLEIKDFYRSPKSFKSLLNGVLVQDTDMKIESKDDFNVVTKVSPSDSEKNDLVFANKCVKHLKSNTIALVKNGQLIGMGCGQTSRVDALKQAITKAKAFDFDLNGAVMASDAFFPFSDCVEIASEAGITSVVQPGGSIRDKDSISFCDEKGMSMVITGTRHFKH
ncbi:bifunctional phosphoribosylaminoimidazolecarboxamide formyltransferase/IMP cyclohydrolase [Membranihabitans maritimus]|uniref:bifunctional phosphoribosylaminoimidazolecarboxamide formyltransferase/IMP cyclohydrolase n=1 Tax=Membranihabitans maritimus TaxID=2904244 RepID=UPI001F01406D|nr:bifunctional phosphoribosylaminoimidazolecarboxamide formyltransferase/IMP cyclohydrolase [Membranihabitans maritimus]